MSTLTALLLNPATGGGLRTLQRIESAALVLHMDDVRVLNLFPGATKDLHQLRLHGADQAAWLAHRPALERSIDSATNILIGWGTSAPTGVARRWLNEQREWALHAIHAAGHEQVWTIGGVPRHPSRWHQSARDRHGHPSGGSLGDVLAQALVRTDVDALRG